MVNLTSVSVVFCKTLRKHFLRKQRVWSCLLLFSTHGCDMKKIKICLLKQLSQIIKHCSNSLNWSRIEHILFELFRNNRIPCKVNNMFSLSVRIFRNSKVGKNSKLFFFCFFFLYYLCFYHCSKIHFPQTFTQNGEATYTFQFGFAFFCFFLLFLFNYDRWIDIWKINRMIRHRRNSGFKFP